MKTLKKVLALVLVLALCAMTAVLFAGCGKKTVDAGSIKVGVIMVGDENEGYTAAHAIGVKEMQQALNLSDKQVIYKWNIPENEKCYEAAVDLAEQGCSIIFANSFSFEDYIIQAAKDYPNIQFCHATGYQAATCGLENVHNFFTSVYESRYVSGVVAGMKLNEMIADKKITAEQAKVGYVGAYSYAEVMSGYTSFFLGMRSVCPTVTMEVKYTGSWANQASEKEAAEALIADGCVLISQHADTTGAPSACQAAKVYSVGYNVSMIDVAPDYALTSASINWGPYYTYATKCILEDKKIDVDWCQGYADGADCITELNTNAIAEGTETKVKEVEDAIKAGTLKVFDTANWTVGGKTISTTATDDLKDKFHNVEYIKTENGVTYFAESTLASAPSFSFVIDGITELNTAY